MLARVLAVALCLSVSVSVSVTSRSSTTCIMAKRILLVFFHGGFLPPVLLILCVCSGLLK